MKKMAAWMLAVFCAAVLAGCGKGIRGAEREKSAAQEEKWAMIPMVMVNGELYLDTGYEGSGGKCGVMDGKITSAVDGSEKPGKDDQSNFGSGYGYQYGEEGTIEVCIDGKWWTYATEEKRQEMQFPGEAERLETGDARALVREKATVLEEILKTGEWSEGTADCLNDFRVTLEGKTYYYHASCGTFNDNEGNRSLTLDDEEREKVNGILEEIL